MAELNLVLVTPEKTLFDRSVASVQLPMFDGSAGFYPGRAPLVGRLGFGELKLNDTDGSTESYFIDGGFVQVKGTKLSVLTSAAQAVAEINRQEAQAELDAAKGESAIGEEAQAALAHRQERARKLVSLAGRN